ncbi:MAG TPA: ankyrin repeat domain-containing protein [Pyrinomonadaceae bacterium]|nr:ankyrin repeat domain-containing protein [Pyrinomonadaceae bacterium]
MAGEMSSAALLTQAVTSGDAKAVSAALANGADVDERNNGGQTAIILAVIFGHTHLVQLLVNSGADPRLRDNLGLDAIEWAQRRGLTEVIEIVGAPAPTQPIRQQIRVEEPPPTETRIDTDDEKSRKWLAGVKQRIQEQARKEIEVQQSVPEPTPISKPEPVVPLVEADTPIFEPAPSNPAPSNSVTNTPLLLLFILVTVSIGAFTGYMIMSQLSNGASPDTPTATTQQQPQPHSFLKGTPVAAGDLAGKSIQLPDAECPVFENEPRPANTAYTVNVHIKIDRTGKVFWARAEGGDEPLRRAASEAASNSTFSPDKLRSRETEGRITYTFER